MSASASTPVHLDGPEAAAAGGRRQEARGGEKDEDEDEEGAAPSLRAMQRVSLCHLAQRPELNGARGVTAGFDAPSGRWWHGCTHRGAMSRKPWQQFHTA